MLISVVIPSFNHERFLPLAVNSALNQSHSALELIIVDDGSTDGSRDYLNTVSDSRCKTIFQGNTGAHAAINRGLAAAQGEILTILNSDDVYHRKRLKKAARLFKKDSADLISTWIELIDENGCAGGVKKSWRNMPPWTVPEPGPHLSDAGDYRLCLFEQNFVATTSNIIFHRRVYEAIGGMRPLRYVHDWDFLLRACKRFRARELKKPLLHYRTHASNTIDTGRKQMIFEILLILALHWKDYRDMVIEIGHCATAVEAENLMMRSLNLQGNAALFDSLSADPEATADRYFANHPNRLSPEMERYIAANVVTD